jgi:hypothetical protein
LADAVENPRDAAVRIVDKREARFREHLIRAWPRISCGKLPVLE